MEEEVKTEPEATKKDETKTVPKKKLMKTRTLIVLICLALFALIAFIQYRADYIETLEIGEAYTTVFTQNMKYKISIGITNFVIVFMMIYITNKLIRRGLKQFFEQEKIDMPKLPNKSLALIGALVTTFIVSNMFLHKVILFSNAAWFGMEDAIYGLDIGFYMFQAPLIGQLLYYADTLMILLTVYIVAYYIICFNVFFDGIDGQTLKHNTFIKQLLFNVMVIVIIMAGIIIFNVQHIGLDKFLTLNNDVELEMVGAGVADNIKLWGYRIFAGVVVISVFVAIRAFKKENTKKVLKSLAVVPVYLVILCVVMFGYDVLFVGRNELNMQKSYIQTNINCTKDAYGIELADEKTIASSGTITQKEVDENSQVINNIPVVTENVAINNLLQTQTSTGYYTYSKAKAELYNNKLTYIAAREIDTASQGDLYTHGYGVIIENATETDEAGNIKYISRDFENARIQEPRIYYGTQDNKAITVSKQNEEFDYPTGATENAMYTYDGDGGIALNFVDKFCTAVANGMPSIVFSGSDSKVLLNRNVIARAEQIIPYLMYDEEPYLVVSDEGKLYWVIDAYTVSNEYPYSQKTKILYKNSTKEINYIRNSIKVVVNAFDGETNFYITDRTDPIAAVYNKMYDGLFKDISEIGEGLEDKFVYPEFLYEIQAEMLCLYHGITPDVLYRGNDIWEISSYSELTASTANKKIEPYYAVINGENAGSIDLGLITTFNSYGKENLNAYLVGTSEEGANILSLYKFTGDNTVMGLKQLENLIEQDETISSEISSLNVTGTRIAKEMMVIPIKNTLLYVVPVYQTSLNEVGSVPVLKKVIVASGNKIAIGANSAEAIQKLFSPDEAVSFEVEDTSTIEGLIDSIIKANKNLKESNDSGDWPQIGRDIESLQNLINQLETIREEENKEDSTNTEQNVA